jgi:leucyl/phenylalanyl-tRNA--protein transferase
MRTDRLSPDAILQAYAAGAFPMTDPDGVTRWYTADPRGILPLEQLHVPRTLRQVIRQRRFEIRINHDFRGTILGCRQARPEGTWIGDAIVEAYEELHRRGLAHSVEAYADGELAGGLYGVSLGAAFFGESMFHRRPDASKVALVALVERLRERGFELLDTQSTTPHLRRFGCIEIPARDYMVRLRSALERPRSFA